MKKMKSLVFVGFVAMVLLSMKAEATEMVCEIDVQKKVACSNAIAPVAEEIQLIDAGYCGSSSTVWGLTTDGILIIAGEGWMPDWTADSVPWARYRNSISAIYISDTITEIGTYSFYSCNIAEEIYIGKGVRRIKDYAFMECYSVGEIIVPDTVTSIGKGAFKRCMNMTKVKLPNKLTEISPYLFSNCTNLQRVTIPNTVKSIGEHAFEYGYCLKSLTIPSGVERIGEGAFYRSNLEKVILPNSVTSMGDFAFRGCWMLREVNLPEQITKIPQEMFYGCTNLKNISIPAKVTEICDKAFSGCDALKKIRVPQNVTKIGNEAFRGFGLEQITFLNPQVKLGNGLVYICTRIRCMENSTAHNYAVNNGYEFELIDISRVTEWFEDVYSDWYTTYVQYVYDHNLMTGISGTSKFLPNDNITKAQVAQVLYNMEGQPEVTDQIVFDELKDVHTYDWYANAVAWAYNAKVVTGDTNAMKFFPNAEVKREELALMMFRYAKYKEKNVDEISDLAGLKNAENVSNWAADGVKWAVGTGLINGIEKNGVKDLAPQGNASRAQMAAILQRFCETDTEESIP